MNKTIISSIVFTVLLQFNIFSQKVTTVNYTHTSPIIDGYSESSWDQQVAVPITTLTKGGLTSPNDFIASFKTMWDDDNLYLFIAIIDEDLIPYEYSDEWEDDGIELYLDMNNAKGGSYDSDDYQIRARYQHPDVLIPIGPSANLTVEQSTNGDTAFYEFSFPWEQLNSTKPENGLEIGLEVQMNDNDGNGRESKLLWNATGSGAWQDPSLFGTAILAGKEVIYIPQSVAPTFSVTRGFYNSAFSLDIISTDPAATIVYTLDGSDPTSSPSAISGSNPVQITIDPTDNTNRNGLTPGVVVRAAGLETDLDYSEIITHSYIFIDEVLTQTNPEGAWPEPFSGSSGIYGRQEIDYNMDQDIVNSPAYSSLMDDAFNQLPSISIVTDIDNLFDENIGIYVNAIKQGWERETSVELLYPNNDEGFQIDAGIRIRGGYSRVGSNPKHAFRLFFRDEYKDGKLEYPLFGNEGTDEFDKVDLRTSQNYSWSYDGSDQNSFLKDVSFRDIQGKMGQPYTKSRYYHLYLNGVYWGIFQTQERAEAHFAEDYLGGDNKDYDVVKPARDITDDNNNLVISATDGDLDAAQRLWDKTILGFSSTSDYYEVQGYNVDGTRNPNYERLLDVDNLIDYVQIAYYAGSYDAPLSSWTSNPLQPNNFYSIYNKNNPDGFKWMVHDFEHVMNRQEDHSMTDAINEDWLITRELDDFSDGIDYFNPVRIHLELMANKEYQQRFIDRAFKNFTTGGALFPDSIQATFDKRQGEIDLAIIAESARWGDSKKTDPYTKTDWLDYIDELKNDYIPFRSDIVLDQFLDLDWYTDLKAASFIKNSATLYAASENCLLGDVININNPNGALGIIYYTTDGSDPRAIGGAINNNASQAISNGYVTVSTSTVLKARILNDTIWSPLRKITLTVDDPITNLKVTEIHYNPLDVNGIDGGNFEFIELKNTGATAINLTGASFTDGIYYTFEATILEPNEFIVLSSSINLFNAIHGFSPYGQYSGGLKNSGEKITLSNAQNIEIISFTYDDESPWPVAPDGLGNSLVSSIHNPTGNPNNVAYWKTSTNVNGSPGEDDPEASYAEIVISEVLTHTDYPLVDAIELYNPTDETVDVSNWFLTDDKNLPTKWQIPAGTTIPALGYITIYEGHYVAESLLFDTNEFGASFSISSHGEDIYLLSAGVDSTLLGYSTGVSFEEVENGVSFGRYTNSVNDIHFVAQEETSLSAENTYPRVGPVVFNQIMYNPPVGQYEYLTIKNISDETVLLNADDKMSNTWKISGIGFDFPEGVSIASGEEIYIIEALVSVTDFRTLHGLTNTDQVFNMVSKLSNDGETLSLRKPGNEYIDGAEIVFDYILIDEVTYNDQLPWPLEADGNGDRLVRIFENEYGNDPINWNSGNETAPHLISDTTSNNINENIAITFVPNARWNYAITSVLIDDVVLFENEFTIYADSITFDKSLFDIEKNYSIEIIAAAFDTATVTQSVLGTPLSINNTLSSSVSVSPNPFKEVINIHLDEQYINSSYQILDMQGKLIKGGVITKIEENINLSGLPKGMYLLNVNHSSGSIVQKLIHE